MPDLPSLITFLVLSAIIGFVIWGNLPKSKGRTLQETANPMPTSSLNREVGLVTGASGGDIQDAAVAGYALGRLTEDLGRAPSTHELGVAVGLAQTVEPPNLENP